MEGPAGGEEAPLVNTFVYKECGSNSELVVRRKLVLYASKFTTFHEEVSALRARAEARTYAAAQCFPSEHGRNRRAAAPQANPKDKKTWQLHRNCSLSPKRADELVQQKRLVRPPGMSSIGATLKGAGQPVQLVRGCCAAASRRCAALRKHLESGLGADHSSFCRA
jgi:hypothetical protein